MYNHDTYDDEVSGSRRRNSLSSERKSNYDQKQPANSTPGGHASTFGAVGKAVKSGISNMIKGN